MVGKVLFKLVINKKADYFDYRSPQSMISDEWSEGDITCTSRQENSVMSWLSGGLGHRKRVNIHTIQR
jgi:hypothetical protein